MPRSVAAPLHALAWSCLEAVEHRGCRFEAGNAIPMNLVAARPSGTEHRPSGPKEREIRIVSSLSLLGLGFFMGVMIGAFAVRSAAGFGAVLIAMPMLAFVLPISTAVSVTTALTAITSVHQVSRDWRRVAWRHFAIMALYSAIGIGLGFYFIKMLDEHALRRSLGVFLILYSIYALATARAFCALARCASGGHGDRRRPPRHAVWRRCRADIGSLFQRFTDGEGNFSGDHEHRRVTWWGGSHSGICEPRVLRAFEHRADRHRFAADGYRLLAGRPADPQARSADVFLACGWADLAQRRRPAREIDTAS